MAGRTIAARSQRGGHPTPARKRFGQHFLEAAWVAKVIHAIDPQPEDRFVEIGPGRGALTRPLLDRVRSVLAFEIDRDLAARLNGSDPRLTIVAGDVMETAPAFDAWGSEPLRVAGNLPYNVASPILFMLRRLSMAGVPLVDATLMLQREVADRLIAGPGGHEYGVLSILVQQTADVRLVLALPPGAFRPAPKVRSALVTVRFHPAAPAPLDQRLFEQLVQSVFTRRRKTMANALLAFPRSAAIAPAIALERAAIDGRRRPETLAIHELARLSDVYACAAPK